MKVSLRADQVAANIVVTSPSAPAQTRVRSNNTEATSEGKLVFRSVIRKDGVWQTQAGDILFSPDKELIVVEVLKSEPKACAK